jgi:hypothetical protein
VGAARENARAASSFQLETAVRWPLPWHMSHTGDAHDGPRPDFPAFKKKAEHAQVEAVLRVLLGLLSEVHPEVLDLERLQAPSFERIDGATLAAEETRLRRRLQGIPEVAPPKLLS